MRRLRRGRAKSASIASSAWRRRPPISHGGDRTAHPRPVRGHLGCQTRSVAAPDGSAGPAFTTASPRRRGTKSTAGSGCGNAASGGWTPGRNQSARKTAQISHRIVMPPSEFDRLTATLGRPRCDGAAHRPVGTWVRAGVLDVRRRHGGGMVAADCPFGQSDHWVPDTHPLPHIESHRAPLQAESSARRVVRFGQSLPVSANLIRSKGKAAAHVDGKGGARPTAPALRGLGAVPPPRASSTTTGPSS